MSIVAKLEELPRPAWFALMILACVVWWPLGLAILAWMIWSGRMGCCGFGFGRRNGRAEAMSETSGRWSQPPTSGNRAFDEYRFETLRRLEQEQREFHEFLARLRLAKDKAEFDQFMAERRTPPHASTS